MTLLNTHIHTVEDVSLVGCDTELLAKLFSNILKDHSAFIFWVKPLELLDADDESIMILCSTGNCLPTNKALCHRRLASSAIVV